jgi:hypothetical protein
MARRDDEIFRKLKKETPLAKRKDIQPLSTRDFDRRKSDLSLERPKKSAKRITPKPSELNVFSSEPKRPGSPKHASKRGAALASRYNNARQNTESQSELSMFGEETVKAAKTVKSTVKVQKQAPAVREAKRSKAADVKAQPEKLSIFTEQTETKRTPQVLHADRGYRQPEPMVLVDQHDFDYMREQAPSGKLDFRHELKYYINYHDYVLLRNSIRALLSLDRYANGDGQYHIRSLYLDDVYETALKDKVAGTDERSKYRIRIYNYSDNVIKFEKKIKRGQFISKVSIGLSRDECDSLIAGNYDFLAERPEPLASEIFIQMKNNVLKPRVIVDYWREAYVSPFENVRVTFDKDLKGGLWLTDIFNEHAPTMPVLDEGMMVLEIKFNRYLPEFIKTVLSNVNTAQRSAISKYVLCRKFD